MDALRTTFKTGQVWESRRGGPDHQYRIIAITDEPTLPVIIRSTICDYTDAVTLDGCANPDPEDGPASLDLVKLVQDVPDCDDISHHKWEQNT